MDWGGVTLNEATGTTLRTDGIIGSGTIAALNNIPEDRVDDFMNTLRENRLEYLQGLEDWAQYANGWTARTNRY